METQEPKDLVELLIRNKKSSEYIIELLTDIIKSQIMYGGSLSDKINYQIKKAKTFNS